MKVTHQLIALFSLLPLTACSVATDAGDSTAQTEDELINLGPITGIGDTGGVLDPGTGDPDQVIVAQGSGWTHYRVSGTFQDTDANTQKTVSNQNVVIVRGLSGADTAPLNTAVKSALKSDISYAMATGSVQDDADMVFVVHQDTANQLTSSKDADGTASATGCNDYNKDFDAQKGFDKSANLDKSWTSGDFTGHVKANVESYGSAKATLRVKVKRGSFLGACIPYAAGFVHVRLEGGATAIANTDVSGQFKKSWKWEKQLAKPGLGSFGFMVGPVPVRLGFNLPIDFGIQASAAASANIKGEVWADADFTYTCTTSGCTGSKSFDYGFTPNGQPSGSVSGKVSVKPWVQGALRAYLYHDSIAYGQVGVRPSLDMDLFGYAGNTCGDGNGDGQNEYVSGTMLNANIKVDLTARASAFGEDWNKSWQLVKINAGTWKWGSTYTPWSPIFYMPDQSGTVVIDPPEPGERTFVGRMRPCWPYADKVDWKVTWGDGKTTEFSLPPWGFAVGHQWSWGGTYQPKLTAVRDSAGRNIGGSATSTVQITELPEKPIFTFPMYPVKTASLGF